MPHQRTRLQWLHWCTIKETATMAQSAAQKSHNLKVVSSVLTCRTFCHSNTGWRGKTRANQKQHKDSLTTVLFRNAASTYNAFTDAPSRRERQWRSRQRVSLIIVRSWVPSSVVALFLTVIQIRGEKPEPTESGTKELDNSYFGMPHLRTRFQ